jgi:hypothetical protein
MAKLDWNIDPERSDQETWIFQIGRGGMIDKILREIGAFLFAS